MLKPLGLTHGHYECRSLSETLPVFTDLLAMKIVERANGQAVVQHPNTAWRLVVHEAGAGAPDKPHNNHYGVRVARAEEEPHWAHELAEREFPGRGYVPQALTHGTLECDDKEASAAFYRDMLGLQLAGGGRLSVYIKHAATPWYIVVLPIPRRKKLLGPANRFTLTLASAAEVESAHRELLGAKGVTELAALEKRDGRASFLFADLNRNWWELAAA